MLRQGVGRAAAVARWPTTLMAFQFLLASQAQTLKMGITKHWFIAKNALG